MDLNPPQPTSIHFVFFIFVFMLISRQIQKSKCGLRWVEVDLNPPQPTSIHFVFSIFVFMLISRKIQKSKSGLRWIEVDLNLPQPTSTHLNPLCIFNFCFYVDMKENTKK